MTVTVRLFAVFAEAAGWESREFEVAADAAARDLWTRLGREHPALAGRVAMVAVDQSWSTLDSPLSAGAEVGFLPPIAGG